MNNRYRDLLVKYCGDEELKELLDLLVLDAHRERDNYFLKNNKALEERCLIGKLRIDLETVKKFLKNI